MEPDTGKEHFYGKVTKNGASSLTKIPEDGLAIFECERGGTTAKVIWTNHKDISLGEVWQLEEKDVPTPAPKVKASRK